MKNGLVLLTTFITIFALSGCKTTEYEDYIDTFDGFEPTYGTKVNNETITDLVSIYGDESAEDINVLAIDDIDDEFIFGVDMSSVLDVYENGGVFYNANGQEQDVFEILKDAGVNYIRIRIWNDPYNDDGEPFGGGTVDVDRGIEIAKRAARVGMRIALDFHYSDFWADPGKQTIPRAWRLLGPADLKEAVYNYTYESIKAFEDAGVRPHMVQVGNEINNGFMFPKARLSLWGYDDVAAYLSEGARAVKDISNEIKVIIHLAEGASEQRLTYFFDNVIENGLDFDVIGLSYYSFWHGTMEQFRETLAVLDERYNQEIAVMEYSYPWTDYSNEFTTNIITSEQADEGGYNMTMQGQVSYVRDVNAAVASIESGIGTFYWEPAWLGVDGAGWAEEGAVEYLTEQGDAEGIGNIGWANQSFFSFTGKALPTLQVFTEMRTSTFNQENILSYNDELSFVLNLRAEGSLPSYTYGFTNLERITVIPITWNQTDIDAMDGPGEYIVNGTIESGGETLPVTCTVTAYENYFENASFEDGGKVTSDISDFSYIDAWSATKSPDSAVRVESKNARTVDNQGHNNLNTWASSDYTFTITQDIELEPGTYEYNVWARSADTLPVIQMIVQNGSTNIATQDIIFGASWSTWQANTLTFTITETTTVTIGLTGDCVASSWSHFDDFSLRQLDE